MPGGWPTWIAIVAAAAVCAAMTAPGQTTGLSVFTDPLIQEMGISRTGISLSYLIGTITGAAAQPLIGRALDRYGARRVIVVVAVAFSVILVGLSFATEIIGLTAGYVGVRMAGQGALSLAATTAVARAIHHHRGLALGISSAIGSAGISLAPIGLEALIGGVGIHAAWRWEALAVLVIVVPVAFVFARPTSASEARPASTGQVRSLRESWTVSEALRSGMFWVISLALVSTGMLSTGLGFHQLAVLGEQGLSPVEAAANFLPQTVTSLLATLAVGALIDRVSPRIIVAVSMLLLIGALVMLGAVQPGWTAIVYGLLLGAAGGALRGMEAAAFVGYYGTAHIGSIRGIAVGISLASTAFGPLAFSVGFDLTGSFALPALVFAGLPLLAAILAAFTPAPHRKPVPSRAMTG